MIKVYDSEERLFASNGIKILHPLIAEVTKKDNGDYFVALIEKYRKEDIKRKEQNKRK